MASFNYKREYIRHVNFFGLMPSTAGPGKLVLTTNGSTDLQWIWTATNPDLWLIQRRIVNEPLWVSIPAIAGALRLVDDIGDATPYQYRIRALALDGHPLTRWSNSVIVVDA